MQTSMESAEIHYKAVIRALVAEALELSHFLDTVAADKVHASQRESVTDGNKQTSMSVQNLDTLDFIDWVRFHNRSTTKNILYDSCCGLM